MEKTINTINNLWENRKNIDHTTSHEIKDQINEVISQIDEGLIRIAEKINGKWITHEWIKKAILLSFKVNENFIIRSGQEFGFEYNASYWYDKVPSKFFGWNQEDFEHAGFRAVPGCFVRYGSFIQKKVVLMPSFVNIGAYIDEGTMIDTWATIGSCAQIGKNCHISGGAGIGGVLEPIQANPVIIEDNCFIGARSEIAEGVIVEEGSVISMGVYLGQSTKIINRETGEITYGRIPKYSVVVPGSTQTKDGLNLYCAVIVKTVDEKTRSKTAINELLRA